jgi:hypothetical protein
MIDKNFNGGTEGAIAECGIRNADWKKRNHHRGTENTELWQGN